MKTSIIIFCISFFFGASVYGQSRPEKIEWIDTCSEYGPWVGGMMQTKEDYTHQYDTVKLFVEHCCPIMPGGDRAAGQAFGALKGAVQFYSDSTNRYFLYRQWLLTVVFLNPSDRYFCSWLGAIMDTYEYDTIPHILNEPLTIWTYAQNHGCGDASKLINQFIGNRHKKWQEFYDLGIDTNAEDTIVLSMKDLGLGFLDTLKEGVALQSHFISSFTTNPNPFITETTLNFTLNRMAYTQLAIYDVLGRFVWGDGRGSSLEAGEHTVHIDGKDLPDGILYARISTGFGEVQTVKLVHDK